MLNECLNFACHLNLCQFIVETTREKHPHIADGRTPLDLACQSNHHQIIEYLSK